MKKSIMMFLLIFIISGCNHYVKTTPLNKREIAISGDKILVDGKSYAEIRYLWTYEKPNEVGHRGVSIYYYNLDKEVWVYPKGGITVENLTRNEKYLTVMDIKKSQVKYKGNRYKFYHTKVGKQTKSTAVLGWCYDVNISNDKFYIEYKTKGIFWDSSNKYEIDYSGI